ncbi:MAG: hypothetical protein HC915_19065 [Anaerolineae bacterium]|nr:hypothetical protein [Anaerolineae bacterium]
MRSCVLMLCVLLLATLACTLTTSESNPTPVVSGGGGRPSVRVLQPQGGASFRVGQTVTVQAQAEDSSGGVSRVELRVNNVIVDSQTSEAPGGERSLTVLLDYVAAVPNPSLTLTVIAYRGTPPASLAP